MNRNLILIITILIFLVGCNSSFQEKPNILFIMSDDHAYQAISAYDDRLIETPNIDRIADEGMLFTNASVTNSICAPSRAVILTGKHSHINGKIDNISKFDDTQMTFPQLFQKAGYQTAMFGKLHFGNNPKGIDDFLILPGQGDYINPKFLGKDRDTIITGYVTDVITDLTLDWFKNKRDKNRPFLTFYLHKAPHRAWWPSPEKFAEFYEKKFPEPETLYDDYSNRGSAAKSAEMNLLTHMQYMQDSKVRPSVFEKMKNVEPKILYARGDGTFFEPSANSFSNRYNRANDEQKKKYDITLDKISKDFEINWPNMTNKEKMQWKYQRYMQDYLATISSVDDNVGRVLDYLEDTGLDKNTIVVYTSDQGFYLGEHGWFDKRFMYEESIRMPFIIKYPGKIKPNTINEDIITNIDFAPTILDIAGINIPVSVQGNSFLNNLTENKNENWRQSMYYHYYEYPFYHHVQPHYGIRNKRYKLIHFYYDIDVWELYDLQEDPNELKNLFYSDDHQNIVKKLKKELYNLKKEYGNELSLADMRRISETDFGGLESNKSKK